MQITDNPRIQPHDLEAECAILGAVLLDSSALSRAQELLHPTDFYDSRHRRIFDAMAELAGRSETIDLLTIGNLLERKGDLREIGGRGKLAELITTIASSANIRMIAGWISSSICPLSILRSSRIDSTCASAN